MAAKIITMHSPIPKTGQTTLANLLGTSLANKDRFVLLIEMSNCTGYSVILNKSMDRVFSSLKTALINPNRTPNNLLKSIHNPNFYFLANSYENTMSELSGINIINIDKVVKQVSDTFDYIIIDLPSDPYSPATTHLMEKSSLTINHHIEVIDENVMSIKLLNEAANIFYNNSYDQTKKLVTTLVVNKSLGRYSKMFEGHLKNMPFFEIENIVDIPMISEYTYLCNEGKLLNLGKSSEAKELVSSMKLLSKIIEKQAKSVGMITKREVSDTSIQKGVKSSIFGRNKKSKKESAKSKVKEPKQPKQPKQPKPAKQPKKPISKKPIQPKSKSMEQDDDIQIISLED